MTDLNSLSKSKITRREALQRVGLITAGLAGVGCLKGVDSPTGGDGRLSARVSPPTGAAVKGRNPLGLGAGRDGIVYVPTTYDPAVAAPLALLLHGFGQNATTLMDPMQSTAEANGLVLLAVDSRSSTWDLIYSRLYNADIDFINRALTKVFSTVRVDASRVRVAGFSDGASYALSIGRINGDFFSKIAAFSAGFIGMGSPHGKPAIFETHGLHDSIFPVDETGRLISDRLRVEGYQVEYHEFDGGHDVPEDLLDQATAWLAT